MRRVVIVCLLVHLVVVVAVTAAAAATTTTTTTEQQQQQQQQQQQHHHHHHQRTTAMCDASVATAPTTTTSSSVRMPTLYVPHGAGPWPITAEAMFDAFDGERAPLLDYYRSLSRVAPVRPRALLVVSAHWETPVATVSVGARPPQLFDYGGFSPAAYRLHWRPDGAPDVARRVRALLAAAGIDSAEHEGRFDHGTFIPLRPAFPDADVPCVQLSVLSSLDAAAHLALGRALAPLRDEGVLIIGSGNSFHGGGAARALGERGLAAARAFDAWLADVCTSSPSADARDAALARWADAPGARVSHAREEHLLPLHVALAAVREPDAVVRVAWRGTFLGFPISAIHAGNDASSAKADVDNDSARRDDDATPTHP